MVSTGTKSSDQCDVSAQGTGSIFSQNAVKHRIRESGKSKNRVSEAIFVNLFFVIACLM